MQSHTTLARNNQQAVDKTQQSGPAIELVNLTKQYGPHRGVLELNLAVNPGEVFGFLGPNGAGKTTAIRMLLNLIKPSAGQARVMGLDSQRDSVAIKRFIGYLPGEFSLYPNLTGAQTLEYFANLRGLEPLVAQQYIALLAERFNLDLSRKFRQYSRGNKQKVGIIQAFMHQPRLLILDEPTSGLDPLNQQEFYNLIHEARETGTTVFFSSHIMSEVEKICQRVGIIRDGRLLRVGTLEELTDIKKHLLELSFANEVSPEEFKRLPGVEQVEVVSRGIYTLHLVAKAESLSEIIKTAARYPIVNFISREPSLEEAFLDYYREEGSR